MLKTVTVKQKNKVKIDVRYNLNRRAVIRLMGRHLYGADYQIDKILEYQDFSLPPPYLTAYFHAMILPWSSIVLFPSLRSFQKNKLQVLVIFSSFS